MNLFRRLFARWTPAPAEASAENTKRHQILGRELVETREVTLSVLAEGEGRRKARTAPGQPQQQFDRQMQLESAVIYAVLEHLGYGPINGLASRLETGADLAVEYFCGDWWRGDDDDARALDKSRPDRELRWCETLPNALLLCGLTGRWEDAARICSWFDDRIHLEERFELKDYEYQCLYLCIVSDLGPEPLAGLNVGEALTGLRQCRRKRPRLLGAIWEAILSGERDAFEKALKESVRHFLRSPQQVPNPNFWVARDESLMFLIAERKGLPIPALPDTLDAAVVRRQTVGLA